MPRCLSRVPCLAGLRTIAVLTAVALLAGCATRSGDVRPAPTDRTRYADWDCERLHEESDLLQQRAADVAYAVDARVGNNMIALGVGVTVFWPALLAMRPDGLEADRLAELKGRFEAVSSVAAERGCGPGPRDLPPRRAAALPVAAGDRLVYDDRDGHAASARALGMRLVALRREGLEFVIDLDGKPLPGLWRQDLAGNPVGTGHVPLHAWRHLLRLDLDLGQTVNGELRAPNADAGYARVRGQVVARGPQTLAGRQFNVLVIELFGEVPRPDGPSARLDGVMAVDAASGVLLRLELNSSHPDYVLRRRLVRVEPATH
jgi:hypothetical protein